MISYKDRAFCSASCITTQCHRQFNDEQQRGARLWWAHDPDNAPVAFMDFSQTCPGYDPKETTC